MSLGPQGGRGLLATMWRLALARQQLLLVAVALVLLDASALSAVIGALAQTNSFGDFARAIYDESRTLADALGRASGGNGACAVAIVVYVFARPWPLAWLRAAYIRGLSGKGGLPRPTWTSVIRLVLLDVLVGTPLAFAIGGLEKADQAALGAPLLLIVLVFTLYADYAIVVDDLNLLQALRSSLHVLVRRPTASLGVTAVWLLLSFALAAALGPSFDSGATPLALTALLVLTGVLGFGLDVCLLTLYRATPPPPVPDIG
ncbi:MAG TPA: hypothetical protein VFD90_09420 [Gaiellales bacterium]|jgi:hypothetical protein|nr:hypothetical protein [Gaiellales bacterium]